MIDGHMHLEFGPLTKEYVMEFVNSAVEKGLDEIQILDHTHRFKEMRPIYDNVANASPLQKEWLNNREMKFKDSLDDYVKLIDEVKQEDLPIKVSFGLEVCYAPEYNELIKEILKPYHFDFLVGAIHSIDGLLYDMKWSKEILWDQYDTDTIYQKYYDVLIKCVESDIFTQVAHPDTIKMFGYHPTYDLNNTYHKFAKACVEHRVKAENNVGCYYRYHTEDMGLSDGFLKILQDESVEIITASDAHQPGDVGNYIKEVTNKMVK